MNRVREPRGFTLIEMIMVITMLGILAVMGANMLGPYVNAYITARVYTATDTVSRIAMKRMVLELREADGVTTGSFPTSDITFTSTGRTIRYYLNGTDLMRQENGGTAYLMAEQVSTLEFDSDGNYVQISLAMDVSNLEIRTRVYPRND